MNRITALIAACLLTACAGPVVSKREHPLTDAQIAEVKQDVAYRLKDPDAAKFRAIRAIDQTHQDGSTKILVCGQVNGKNSYGAYTGYTYFNGWLVNGDFQFISISSGYQEYVYASQCSV